MQDPRIVQMHWDMAKLLSLGVSDAWLKEVSITPKQARELLKGILYLRERYDDVSNEQGHTFV